METKMNKASISKEEFSQKFNNLILGVNDLIKIVESNRRLLAGLTALLIKKEVLTADDVSKVEAEVLK